MEDSTTLMEDSTTLIEFDRTSALLLDMDAVAQSDENVSASFAGKSTKRSASFARKSTKSKEPQKFVINKNFSYFQSPLPSDDEFGRKGSDDEVEIISDTMSARMTHNHRSQLNSDIKTSRWTKPVPQCNIKPPTSENVYDGYFVSKTTRVQSKHRDQSLRDISNQRPRDSSGLKFIFRIKLKNTPRRLKRDPPNLIIIPPVAEKPKNEPPTVSKILPTLVNLNKKARTGSSILSKILPTSVNLTKREVGAQTIFQSRSHKYKARHTGSERMRRALQRNSLERLQSLIPVFKWIPASRANKSKKQTLDEAASYCRTLQKLLVDVRKKHKLLIARNTKLKTKLSSLLKPEPTE
jgi:hypothetical protein